MKPASIVIQPELRPGEQLLWSGQPAGGVRFRPSDLIMIPFSLMWAGFACFWEYSVLTQYQSPRGGNPPFFFVLWGIPFVCVGLYITIGRFFHDAWLRSRTYYAITDRRLIIVTNGFSRNLRSLDLRQLPSVELQFSTFGLGSINFGSPNWDQAGFSPRSTGSRGRIGFEMLPDCRQVYEILESAREKALRTHP